MLDLGASIELTLIPKFGTPGTGTDGGDHFADDTTLCGSGTFSHPQSLRFNCCHNHIELWAPNCSRKHRTRKRVLSQQASSPAVVGMEFMISSAEFPSLSARIARELA